MAEYLNTGMLKKTFSVLLVSAILAVLLMPIQALDKPALAELSLIIVVAGTTAWFMMRKKKTL
ncbi:MAG: hypothetical protein ABSB38_04595 [Dehalococcoidia bacterium]|jgi:hypothetical protein